MPEKISVFRSPEGEAQYYAAYDAVLKECLTGKRFYGILELDWFWSFQRSIDGFFVLLP